MKPGMTIEKPQAGLQPLFHQILNREVTEKPFAKASPLVKQEFLEDVDGSDSRREGPRQPAQRLFQAASNSGLE